MSIYSTYKAMLQNQTPGADLTEVEFVEIQEALGDLTTELNSIGEDIEEECELPSSADSWRVRDLILFLEAIEGQWYEQIFVKSLRGQQNLVEMLEVLESRG